MANPKKFSWDWDYTANALKITIEFLDGKESVFGITKENLVDMNAGQFVKLLNSMQEAYAPYAGITVDGYKSQPKPVTATQIKQEMATASQYMLLDCTFKPPKKATMVNQSMDNLAFAPEPKTEPDIKELHVYDLGDGMLVPCQLAHEIAEWIKPHNGWWMYQEMVEDDLYGAAAMAEVQAIATKIDKAILDKAASSLFPGKVFIVDDDAIHYMTDPNAFFPVDIESEKFDFIATKHMQKDLMHALLYGSPMKLQAEPATVAIPKKPAQVTKQSLEYFHKILGGKKDPYIK